MSNTPRGKVESFLNNYISMSDSVIADLESKVNVEKLSNNNKSIYRDVLTRQYKDLKYEIKDESINGDTAIVKAKITVYDLFKVEKDSLNYANENQKEFLVDGSYNEDVFNEYRLNEMMKTNDTVSYEIDFYLNKKDNEWILQEPDRITLEKIHGLYNYDIE